MTSAELEDVLYRYSNQIDKEHVDLFLSLINISKISNPFLLVIMSYICIIAKKFTQNLLKFVDVKYIIKNIFSEYIH